MRSIQNFIIFFILVLSSGGLSAEPSIPLEQAALDHLLAAIADEDYDKFIANVSKEFKQGIPKQEFDSVANQLGSYLKRGYTSEYLASLTQRGKNVHLWKISYSTMSENTLVKLILDNGEVKGFFLD